MDSCINCSHFYYNNDGSGDCDASYKQTCLHLNHKFHTDPIEFLEKYLDIKLYWYQKLLLKRLFCRGKYDSK